MAVQWILGRAGTGKTRYCVDQIAAALKEDPLGDNTQEGKGPLLWVLPQQATFTAERLLVTHPELNGMIRGRVLSFRRLMMLLAGELGVSQVGDLDELSRLVLLEDIVLAHREKLKLFGPAADRPGFLRKLDAMLRELMQAGHTGGSLRSICNCGADASELQSVPRGTLQEKLHDLALILDAWDSLLEEKGFETDRLPQLIAPRISRSGYLKHARIWVDSFSALSVMEEKLLVAMAAHVEELTITLLVDPDSSSMRNTSLPLDPCGLFRRTEELYRRLRDSFRKAGVSMERDILLRKGHRFKNSVLRRVEQEMWGESNYKLQITNYKLEGTKEAKRVEGGGELWECQSREVEVRAVAQRIRAMVVGGEGNGGSRYRDIGVVVPGLEEYAEAIRRVFTHHGIPHFIDLRRPITHHPLVELVRMSALILEDVAESGEEMSGGISQEHLLLWLKTGLTPIADEDVHVLENYLLAHGIHRVAVDRAFLFVRPNVMEEDSFARVEEFERRMLRRVNGVREKIAALFSGLRETPDRVDWIRGLLERMGVEGKLFGAGESEPLSESQKDSEIMQVHHQAWKLVMELLERLKEVMEGGKEGATDRHRQTQTEKEVMGETEEEKEGRGGGERFIQMVEAGLEVLSAGLVPSTLDQVLVTSVSRSRHPELKTVFVMGAVESQMPLVGSEDPILTDAQRVMFNQAGEVKISPGADQRLLDSRFFDYVALTRASEELIVSWPAADEQGKPAGRSVYVEKLEAIFGVRPETITAETLFKADRIATMEDACIAAILEKGQHERTNAAVEEWENTGVYGWLKRVSDAEKLRALLARIREEEKSNSGMRLDEQLAGRLFGDTVRMSVSQLERYASCPLQYFFHYTLGLKKRDRFEMDVLQIGTMFHAVLQLFFDEVIAGTICWPECGAEEMRAGIERAMERVSRELHEEISQQMAAYEKLKARTAKMVTLVAEAQRRAAAAGVMRPIRTEMGFGGASDGQGSDNYFPLKTGKGRVLQLSGKIDRVDQEKREEGSSGGSRKIMVVDYKLSEKKFPLHHLLYGLTLQLPVYLLVLERMRPEEAGGKMKPAASFFVPLKRNRKSVSRQEAPEAGGDAFFQQYHPSGLMDADAIGVLDLQAAESQKSEWYPYQRKKDGGLAARSDALEHDDFETVLDYVQWKMAQMTDMLADGVVEAYPYKEGGERACDRCEFSTACPFDQVHGKYHVIRKLKRDETLAAMKDQMERESEEKKTEGAA